MLSRIQKISILDAVAFVTGFGLMAYELVASRLLAPTIGSSTYVWTSVIGVIIAALSLGYTFGGIIADKRVQIADLAYLLLASACCMLATIFLADGVLEFISTHLSDPRLQGLFAALLLFMPASFLIGMISPYLVRLRNVSVATTGRSVASLSALNAIGGIIGTFCAGFLFFGYFGSKETVGFISLLFIGVSWCITPKQSHAMRLLITAVAIALGINAYAPKTDAAIQNIDTPSAHYRIIDGFYQREPVRVLSSGPYGSQSGVYRNGKTGLVFPYAQQIANLVDQAPHKQRILVLGGGTFTIPDYLSKKYPTSQVDVVEIDPKLLSIAKESFSYRPAKNVHHIFADARAYVNSKPFAYDIIIADVYGDISIPFAVTTTEYVDALKASLTTDGTVIANVIASPSQQCHELFSSLTATYDRHFTQSKLYGTKGWPRGGKQNVIALYSNAPLSWATSAMTEIEPPSGGHIFTDNFAPLERLEQQCGNN